MVREPSGLSRSFVEPTDTHQYLWRGREWDSLSSLVAATPDLRWPLVNDGSPYSSPLAHVSAMQDYIGSRVRHIALGPATLQFYGSVPSPAGGQEVLAGLALDSAGSSPFLDAVGNSDGSLSGVLYFATPEKRGVFSRPDAVVLLPQSTPVSPSLDPDIDTIAEWSGVFGPADFQLEPRDLSPDLDFLAPSRSRSDAAQTPLFESEVFLPGFLELEAAYTAAKAEPAAPELLPASPQQIPSAQSQENSNTQPQTPRDSRASEPIPPPPTSPIPFVSSPPPVRQSSPPLTDSLKEIPPPPSSPIPLPRFSLFPPSSKPAGSAPLSLSIPTPLAPQPHRTFAHQPLALSSPQVGTDSSLLSVLIESDPASEVMTDLQTAMAWLLERGQDASLEAAMRLVIDDLPRAEPRKRRVERRAMMLSQSTVLRQTEAAERLQNLLDSGEIEMKAEAWAAEDTEVAEFAQLLRKASFRVNQRRNTHFSSLDSPERTGKPT